MRDVPQVVSRRIANDEAHHATIIALETVLDWFQDDGYTADDLRELCESTVETMYEEE